MGRRGVVWFGILAVVFSANFVVAEEAARLEKITMRVPPGFRGAPGTTAEPYTNTGWAKEVIHEKTGMEMVFIPAGEFMMGSPSSEEGRDSDEGPVHRVKITRPFYLRRYEVTQGEWQKVMGDNPSHFKGSERLPVERVSWNDCQEFLSRAGDGLRLPTEAQWEYACRAGTNTPFHFGNTINTEQVNYDGNYPYGGRPKGVYREKTVPVGSFQPNAWGLYDMHGNVCEWCQDRYDGNYYSRSPQEDPAGPGSGGARVLRGGSWCFNARLYWAQRRHPLCRVLRGGSWCFNAGSCRSAIRGRGEPTSRGDNGGFRAARGLE